MDIDKRKLQILELERRIDEVIKQKKADKVIFIYLIVVLLSIIVVNLL